MKELLIISGKGGTGKTTLSSTLIELNNVKNFADCDVDAPNLDLLSRFETKAQISDFYGAKVAFINTQKCMNCGLCARLCQFDAISYVNDELVVDDMSCEGCSLCEYACPAKTISMHEIVTGELRLYKDKRVFSTATLQTGAGNSGLLVSKVKENLESNLIKDEKLQIIDGAPGIGCPVIASLNGADAALIVTEPSISGLSDMKRIASLAKNFNVKLGLVINKFDINLEFTQNIKDNCKNLNIEFLGEIPYDKNAVIAINNGKTLASLDSPAANAIKNLNSKILDFAL